MITVDDIVRKVVDLALEHFGRKLAESLTSHTKTIVAEPEAIVAAARRAFEQALIASRFAELDIAVAHMEAQAILNKIEEAAAYARGRANALPNVEIVPPEEEDK